MNLKSKKTVELIYNCKRNILKYEVFILFRTKVKKISKINNKHVEIFIFIMFFK